MTENLTPTGMRPTQQGRSLATRNRILEAVEGALEEGRLETLTIQELVTKAQCSVGAFYGRFSDKDAALAALFALRREVFTKKLLALVSKDLDLETWAHKCAVLSLDHALANRALLTRAAVQNKSQILNAAAATNNLIASAVGAMIGEKWLPGVSKPEAEAIAGFVLLMQGATTRDTVINFPDTLKAPKSRRWFVEQLSAATTSYIRKHKQ